MSVPTRPSPPQHQWKRFSMTLTHCGECPNYEFLCKSQVYGCVKLRHQVCYAGVHPDCPLPDIFDPATEENRE